MNKNKKHILGEFAYAMCCAPDYESAFKALNDLVEMSGYVGLLYTFIPQFKLQSSSVEMPIISVSEGYSPEFISHYMEARFDQQDAMIKAISGGKITPMNWWEEVLHGKLSKDETLVLETGRQDYGVNNGITIPALAGDQGIACASIISGDKDLLFKSNLLENQQLIECCVKLFHQRVMLENWRTEIFVEPLLGKFNTKERSVLAGLIIGKSAKIIASDNGIGVKYVEKTIRQLRFKISGENDLGNPNISTAELIYQAGLLSLMNTP